MPIPRFRFVGFLPGLLLVSAIVTAQQSAPTVSSQPAPDRSFRLFVGMDVEVSQDQNYGLIQDYVNNRVQTSLAPGLVSLRNVDDMRFTYTTKLSRSPITVAKIQTKQIEGTVYAAREAMRDLQAVLDFRDTQMAGLESNLRSAAAGGQVDANGEVIIESEEQTNAVNDAANALSNFDSLTSKITNDTDLVDQLKRTESDAPTALSITAEIQSPTRISDAYVIGVARISSEKSVGDDVLFFKKIGRLDTQPKQIQIIREGLPKDFKVLDVRLHIYRNGQELATNQSQKQFALTRAEAIEFLALLRTSENRGESLPPEPVWALAPPQLFAESQPDEFDYPLTIKVDKLGQVVAIDENTIATPAVRAAVEELFFLPALEAGVPVAGVAQINLKDFYR